MNKEKKLNSSDIAKLAGVSRSTVSRVVNGYPNVPEETRQKVMKVIEENAYYPLLSGQLLAGKKTGTIGFFWITTGDIANDFLTSSYFALVTEAAAKMGYLVLCCIIDDINTAKNIDWVKSIFMQGRIDAGIFIGTNNVEPLIEELIGYGNIVGLFDHFRENNTDRNRIAVNFENDTGEKAIDYAYSMGHRKIAIIDGNMKRYSSIQRHEGYIRGMLKHNIELRNDWMYYGGIVAESGYKAMCKLLKNCGDDLPTIVCANNDSVAFGVMQALEEHSLSVPQDISIIGIDGHPRAAFSSPPLTTFAFDYADMFTSLVRRTIETINQKENVPLSEDIPSILLERGSCKVLPQ